MYTYFWNTYTFYIHVNMRSSEGYVPRNYCDYLWWD